MSQLIDALNDTSELLQKQAVAQREKYLTWVRSELVEACNPLTSLGWGGSLISMAAQYVVTRDYAEFLHSCLERPSGIAGAVTGKHTPDEVLEMFMGRLVEYAEWAAAHSPGSSSDMSSMCDHAKRVALWNLLDSMRHRFSEWL